MLQCVLFDLGNVLVDFCHQRMVDQLAELLSVSPETVRTVIFEKELRRGYECGRVSDGEYKKVLETIAGRHIPVDEIERASADIFTRRPAAEKLVRHLANNDVRLVLLSNTCPAHIRWLSRQTTLFEPFAELILSYKIGALKPEPRIYQAALEVIRCHPSHCLFIDDLAPNIEGAKPFGFQTHLYRDLPGMLAALGEHGLAVPTVECLMQADD